MTLNDVYDISRIVAQDDIKMSESKKKKTFKSVVNVSYILFYNK